MGRPRSPSVFRVLLGAADLERSRRFYESLLGVKGRRVADGRIYFECGSVILGLLDRSAGHESDRSPPTEAIYFATHDLEGVHRRARRLGCLDPDLLHGDPANPMGEVTVRPWGERSFYATDPSGNPLCFVDAPTKFTGTPRQVAALERARGERTPVRSRRRASSRRN
jgi:catechol 2,3-dioxygenase-like lactoylglutathione lyase family enzyme